MAPVLLYGDSHMSHWRPGIDRAAESLGVPLVHSILGNCFPYGEGIATAPPFCPERSAGLLRLVEDLRPSAVIVSTATVYGDLLVDGRVADDQGAAWTRATHSLADELGKRGIPLLLMLDTPRYEAFDPLECIAEHGPARRCARTRSAEIDRQRDVTIAMRRGLERAGHGSIWDPLDITCPERYCALVDGSLVVPLDGHHVTAEWSASQAPVFRRLLKDLLEDSAPTEA